MHDMISLLKEAVEALAQLPDEMQEQAARIIIEFVSYQSEPEAATA